MQRYQYIPIDSILAKYHRDFRGVGITEDDAIEWIAEALGHIKMPGVSEESVWFTEVKNYQADLPTGLQYVVQVARSLDYDEDPLNCSAENIVKNIEAETTETTDTDCLDCDSQYSSDMIAVDSDGTIIGDYEVAYYRPFFNLQYEYGNYRQSEYFRRNYVPVRLSNHSFFNSLVCREEEANKLYFNTEDEYTLVNNKLRFSFKEGFIALAYLRHPVDMETGYPMIPDDESARAAITYYLGWKVKERECWNHRQGSCQLANKAEMRYLKYIKQFKNKTKMPYGADQYENLKQGSMYILPNNKRYYGFFGNLGRGEDRKYGNPDNRNQRYNLRGVNGRF